MSYFNIFSLDFTGANPLYPLVGGLFCAALYSASFEFGYNRIIQKLYAETTDWKMIYRVQFYLFLVNLPFIALNLFGLIVCNSTLPLETTLKIDEVYILIVCGYICYLEESRQTPIRGFVFIKDTFFILISLAVISQLSYTGQVGYQQSVPIIPIYIFALIIQVFTDEIQNFILLALGVRQKNNYRASFLLTEKSHPSNFLEIKDIIATYRHQIDLQLQDFERIALKLKKSNEEINILINFAKLFIPLKKAYQIHQAIKEKQILQDFQQSWKQNQEIMDEQKQKDDDNTSEKPMTFNTSGSNLFMKKTFTTDSFIEDESGNRKEEKETMVFKVLKHLFYPLYRSMQITGRLRYFMDYLIVIIIIGCMFVLANSIAYFSYNIQKEKNLISLIYCGMLFYPTANYFIKISAGANDFDFLGIFMQSIIIKVAFVAVGLIVLNFLNNNTMIENGLSWLITYYVRFITLVVYAGFLAWRRFAMRYNNFTFFVGLFIFSEVVKIIKDSIMDNLSMD